MLEVGKLVTASWLYRNWKETTFLLRSYLTLAVMILMFITSMGIFGYLSKAHLDQTAPVQDNAVKVERLDNRIQREQQKINNSEKVLAQLDSALDTLIEYDKINGPEGMIAVREQQSEQRAKLNESIDQAQAKISEYEDSKYQLTSEIRKVELEVGPVKYIAELIYDNPDSNIDQAVRIVIMIIVFVFDPLAVLLLIAANQSLIRLKAANRSTEKTAKTVESPIERNKTERPGKVDTNDKVEPNKGFEAKKSESTRHTEVNSNNNKLS